MTPPLAMLLCAEAYVLLCNEALDDARQALRRSDREALHDLRVALRRLRIVVRAYGCGGAPRREALRLLAKLGEMTNLGRDTEVMLGWLAQQWPHLDPSHRSGAHHWRRMLLRAQRSGALPRKRVARRVARVAALLRQVPLRRDLVALRFGEAAAQPLARRAVAWQRLVGGERVSARLHGLRIEAKRLRYLLLPFREELAACGAAEQRLQQLQALLGEWHDGVVRRQSVQRALRRTVVLLSHKETTLVVDLDAAAPQLRGLLELMRLTARREQSLLATIRRRCFSDSGAAEVAALQRAATALRAAAAG